MEVQERNNQVHGNDIHRFGAADIAVAVATDKGLITPFVPRADERSVAEITQLMAGLAQLARSGNLKLEEYRGGSFSLSNPGDFGADQFDAITNPPTAAILAIGMAPY